MFDFVDLTYDDAGLITHKARPWPGGGGNVLDAVYTYDGANRLLTETYKQNTTAKHTMTYTYDQAGNRDTMDSDVAGGSNMATTYTYDDMNRLTTDTGYWDSGTNDTDVNTFDYDDNGNVLEREYDSGDKLWEYAWNEDDRLTSAVLTIGLLGSAFPEFIELLVRFCRPQNCLQP